MSESQVLSELTRPRPLSRWPSGRLARPGSTEVFWLTGLPSWVMIGIPIDIERPDAEIMADIDRIWQQTRHVRMGEKPDAAAIAAMERAREEARKPAVVSRLQFGA